MSASSTAVYAATGGAVSAGEQPGRAAEPAHAAAASPRRRGARAAGPTSSATAATPGDRAVGGQDPGAHGHRRGQLDRPQHVEEARRPAEVVDQRRHA